MNVFLNGEYMPIELARVPVLDRGFLFGAGLYEVIPVYSRRPFRLKQHLAPLQDGCDAISISNPYDARHWGEIIGRVVESNPWEDQAIYLQVTRGVFKRDHVFPKDIKPTVFVMANPLVTPSPAAVENGLPAITAQDFRWTRADIKSVSLLGNCMLRSMADDAGCIEAILLRDGMLTEASVSNVFIVKGGHVITPPNSNLMLPGTTCDVVLELLASGSIAHEVRPVTEAELRAADEIWLTSSSKEVLAVNTLDGKLVGTGKPGPMFRKVHALYQDYKASVMRAPADV